MELSSKVKLWICLLVFLSIGKKDRKKNVIRIHL